MSLEQLSKTVDFVQDATPSDANDGETYLDVSQSPPQLKVFDGTAGAFVRPRSVQNLDAPVSAAGATQSDIETGAEGALEQDIANLSPASNSVADNLDGGVAAVDWSSKTPKFTVGTTTTSGDNYFDVSGSGYIFSITALDITETNDFKMFIDGNEIISTQFGRAGLQNNGNATMLHRFESSFALENGSGDTESMGAHYALD